jgi:hypothetical protein
MVERAFPGAHPILSPPSFYGKLLCRCPPKLDTKEVNTPVANRGAAGLA